MFSLSLTATFPELLLAVSAFLFFFLFLHRRGASLPISTPLVGHLPYLFLHIHRLHDFATDTLRRSASTFVFYLGSTRALLTADPANVNHVFISNFPNFHKGLDFGLIFDFLGSAMLNSDGESWKFQRRMIHSIVSSHKFRASAVESAAVKVRNHLLPLLELFSDSSSTDVVDLQDVFARLSLDTTCALVFGIDPGCLSPGFPSVPFMEAMDGAMEAAFFRHFVPPAFWKLLRWTKLGPEKKMEKAAKVLNHFVRRLISQKKKKKRNEEEGRSAGDSADFLTSILEYSEDDVMKSGLIPDFDKFVHDQTLGLLLAGRDTVSSALTWFFYMISTHPQVESKILEEIEQVRGTEGLDIPSNLGRLVYLHASLLESLRLHPAAGAFRDHEGREGRDAAERGPRRAERDGGGLAVLDGEDGRGVGAGLRGVQAGTVAVAGNGPDGARAVVQVSGVQCGAQVLLGVGDCADAAEGGRCCSDREV